jgi:hypothetical protein
MVYAYYLQVQVQQNYMPRLILHVEEYNNWSFFIGFTGYSFSVFGKQQINPQTIFNSKFYNINELGDYLEEVMNFQPNKTNFRISLFCYNLTAADANDDSTHDESNTTYTELENYSVQRRGEVVKYNDVELTTYRCIKYLNFVRNDTYVTDK